MEYSSTLLNNQLNKMQMIKKHMLLFINDATDILKQEFEGTTKTAHRCSNL